MGPQAGLADNTTNTAGTGGIYELLAGAAADAPRAAFLRDGADVATYGDVLARADEMAQRLSAIGLDTGSRVVIWLPNGVEFATVFFACARIGAVAVMAGTRLRAVDIRHILRDSRADALVFRPRFIGIDYDAMVETALRGDPGTPPPLLLTTARSVAPGARCLDDLPRAEAPSCDDAGAPAVVCYTSGTTGKPKGCVHTHGALLRNARVAAALTGLRPDDRIVCPVPFAHVFGFHMALIQGAVAHAEVVNAEPYDAARLLDIAEATQSTVLYAVPTMAREALAAQRQRPRDLARLRLALIAGAPVTHSLRSAVAAPDGLGCDVSVVYGCTEAPTLAQLVPGDAAAKRLDSVGRPTPGVDLRVVAGGTTEQLAPGEPGEIVARGYNRMAGYLDDPEATAERLRDDWLLTGDVGWLDADGYLYLVGRSSEMFLVGGFNAYPREIESQLELLPGVVEAAVIGVPDARLGSVPMAWVTVDSPGLGEHEVLAWARAELASYKRPRHVRVVESLPRTGNGKVSRVKLEQLARRALPQLEWEALER